MKITLEWGKPNMIYDVTTNKSYPSKTDRDYIFLDITITGLTESESYEYINKLEDAINKSSVAYYYGTVSFARCTAYGDTADNTLLLRLMPTSMGHPSRRNSPRRAIIS